MRSVAVCLTLLIVFATATLCHAFDTGCGVNWFDSWCKSDDDSGNGKDTSPSEKEKKKEQQVFEWMPKDTPPVVTKMVQDPTPENVRDYQEWVAKRYERSQQIGAMIRGTNTETVKPNTEVQNVPFVKAIYFFREDCPHCAKMTPMITKVQGSGKIVGVGVQSTDASAADYLTRHGVKIPSAGDMDGTYAKNYKIQSVPTIVFLDDKGNTVRRVEGEQSSETLMRIFGGNL